VTVPSDAMAGEQDLATVTATSQGNPVKSDQAVLTTTALATYSMDCSSDNPALSGLAGQKLTYTVTLTNTSNTTDTIVLDASGNSWTTNLPVTEATLGAGESTQVIVYVTIPADAAGGEYDTATITATSQGDPGVSDSATLTTTALVTFKIYMPLVGNDSSSLE